MTRYRLIALICIITLSLASFLLIKACSSPQTVTVDIIRQGNVIEIYHHDTHDLIFEYSKTKPGDQPAWENFNDVLIEVSGRQQKGELDNSPQVLPKAKETLASLPEKKNLL